MSNSRHNHHHKHHRRNVIDRFLDRLRGKSRPRPYKPSNFPGIHLPEDYDPENARKKQPEKPDLLETEKIEAPKVPVRESGIQRPTKRRSLFSRIVSDVVFPK